MPDVPAHQFPHELDGEPELATRLREGGVVSGVTLRIPLQMLLRTGAGEEHLVSGTGVFGGADPRTVGLEVVATPEQRMIEVLRRARRLVGEDEIGRELDGHLARLYDEEPVRGIGGLFLPTGPLQELAEAQGWGEEFLALADRVGAITMVAEDSWACHVCREDAGSLALSETGELRCESFAGVLTRTVRDPATFNPVWDALALGQAARLYELDPALVPWWCPECRRAYCGDHWDSGRCPQGHER